MTAAVGAVVFILCAATLPQAYHTPNSAPFVPRLIRSMVLGVGCSGSVYAISKLGGRGFAAPDVIAAGAIGVVALAVTAALEIRSQHPLVPREVWRGGRVATGLLLVSFARGSLIVTNFVIPFLLGVVFSVSTTVVGLLMAVSAGVFAATSPRAAVIAQRIGPPRLIGIGIGTSLVAYALFALASWWNGAPIALVAVALAIVGCGAGLTVTSTSRAAVDAIPLAARASGGMLLPTAGFVGMAIHITLVEWVFAWRVPGGFSVVDHTHDAALVASSRGGFAAVCVGMVLVAAVGIALSRRLTRLSAA